MEFGYLHLDPVEEIGQSELELQRMLELHQRITSSNKSCLWKMRELESIMIS